MAFRNGGLISLQSVGTWGIMISLYGILGMTDLQMLFMIGILFGLIAMHSICVIIFFWIKNRRFPNSDEFWEWLKDSIANAR